MKDKVYVSILYMGKKHILSHGEYDGYIFLPEDVEPMSPILFSNKGNANKLVKQLSKQPLVYLGPSRLGRKIETVNRKTVIFKLEST